MPRLKSPLFSLDAHGSLNSTLTYTSRRNLRRALAIPTHPDAATPYQLRHRFLYRLGVALWNGLAAGERVAYAAQTVGQSLTPMNVFLKEWLLTTPNLLIALPLLQASGPTAFDMGPNSWPATLYGPSWVPHEDATALLADGIDDYATLPDATALPLNHTNMSIVFRFTRITGTAFRYLASKWGGGAPGWDIIPGTLGRLLYTSNSGAGRQFCYSGQNVITLGTPAVHGLSVTVPSGTWYHNGSHVPAPSQDTAVNAITAQVPTFFAYSTDQSSHLNARLDWFIAFDRTLTQAEHLAIARAFSPGPL